MSISTTVTFKPIPFRFSAISNPIKPPPTTVTDFTWLSETYALILSVSGTDHKVIILDDSMPGIGGIKGDDPVDITNLSYSRVYSVLSAILTVIFLFFLSIEVTVCLILTSMLYFCFITSGVSRSKELLCLITLPM